MADKLSIRIPKISPALHRLTASAIANQEDLKQRVNNTLSSIEKYSNLNSTAQTDIRNLILLSSRLLLDALLASAMPSEDDLEHFADHGRRMVYQGIGLEDLLNVLRVGFREIWGLYVDPGKIKAIIRNEILFSVSHFLLEFFDILAHITSHAYQEEHHKQDRWRESLKHQLCSIIFDYPDDADRFFNVASALSIDGCLPRIALTIDITRTDSSPATFKNEIARVVAEISRNLDCSTDDILDCWSHGKLITWIPAWHGNSMRMTDRHVSKEIASMVVVSPEIRSVGVGLPGVGASGWAMSADEAGRALRFGRRCDDQTRVYLYSEIAVEDCARRTKRTRSYLMFLIEQLATEPDLLTTLQTYFNHLQRRKATASVLGIHPNTLNYRLDRIESILGARLDDTGWIARLDVAIKILGS